MPVRLEHIHTPTAADLADLEKIHNETASDGFTLNSEQLSEFLASGGWIMAGRFNDRIIGALLAQAEGNDVVLSNAGVRAITQRRGVMHQMIHHISRFAEQEHKRLVIRHCPAQLAAALEHREFRSIGDEFVYNGLQ